MTNVLKMPTPLRLRCSSCGATQAAACECGVAYVPAGEFAAKAIADNPSLSDRAIAARAGVAPNTVRQQRDATAQNCAVETNARIGRDGKERVLPTPRREGVADAPPPRVEETRATVPREDFATPEEADRAIVLLADRVKDPLFLPPPGILTCCREAFARASPKHQKAIEEAAYTLSEIVKK